MMCMDGLPVWMMGGMAIFWLMLLTLLGLGIAALIKYLRSPNRLHQ